jgi:hypothetical protein
VQQFRTFRELKCADPKNPARWSENRQGHYDWCRRARESSANDETRARSNAISTCRRCHSYAGGAIVSARANVDLRCGFTGPRWGMDFEGHRRWCLGARQSSQEAEDRARDRALRECRRPARPLPSGPIPTPPAVRFCTDDCNSCTRQGLRCSLNNNCSFQNFRAPFACHQ